MAMISGPYTDAVVAMMMASGDVETALFRNEVGCYGFFDGDGFIVADTVVTTVTAASFGASRPVAVPELRNNVLRLARSDGGLWLIRLEDAVAAAFHRCYAPRSDGETLTLLRAAMGKKAPAVFPFRCKIGFPADGDAEDLLCIEETLVKLR